MNKEFGLSDVKEEFVKCDKCDNDGVELHPCPYLSDICDDNESLCNCCEDCEYNCAMDI